MPDSRGRGPVDPSPGPPPVLCLARERDTDMRYLSLLLLLCACAPSEDDATDTTDAQYICNVFWDCWGIDGGPTCAQDIESTTAPVDVATCAACMRGATCQTLGDPGEPGACDAACSAAVFGG